MLRNTHHHDDPKSAIARSLRSANVNTNSYNHEICLASKGSSSGKPPTGSFLRPLLISTNESVSNHCRISIVFRPSGSLAGNFPAPPLARMSSRHEEPMYSIPPPAPIMVDQPVRE